MKNGMPKCNRIAQYNQTYINLNSKKRYKIRLRLTPPVLLNLGTVSPILIIYLLYMRVKMELNF